MIIRYCPVHFWNQKNQYFSAWKFRRLSYGPVFVVLISSLLLHFSITLLCNLLLSSLQEIFVLAPFSLCFSSFQIPVSLFFCSPIFVLLSNSLRPFSPHSPFPSAFFFTSHLFPLFLTFFCFPHFSLILSLYIVNARVTYRKICRNFRFTQHCKTRST